MFSDSNIPESDILRFNPQKCDHLVCSQHAFHVVMGLLFPQFHILCLILIMYITNNTCIYNICKQNQTFNI